MQDPRALLEVSRGTARTTFAPNIDPGALILAVQSPLVIRLGIRVA